MKYEITAQATWGLIIDAETKEEAENKALSWLENLSVNGMSPDDASAWDINAEDDD